MILKKVKHFASGFKGICLCLAITLLPFVLNAQEMPDSLQAKKTNHLLDEVIVTGTRNETTVRNLPLSISVVPGMQIDNRQIQSVLPILNEQVPGLFITSRGIMGYGVSTGAAGTMRMRGIGGSPTTGLLMLIDGVPQYMGLMGHPIADIYQTMFADRVEVVRGPASLLYGSNAMGGVIHIVTSKLNKDTIQNKVRVSYGSFHTLESAISNCIQKGRFSSKAAASYNRTGGHRENMDFDQYAGYAKMEYKLSKRWSVCSDMNITHFNASNPGTINKPLIDNDSHITRGMITFSVENKYSQTSGSLKLYHNWGNHEINDGYSEGEQPKDYLFQSHDQMTGLSCYQSVTVFPGNRITAGFDFQHFGGKAGNRFTKGSETIIVDTTLYEIAGYVDFRQSIGSYLTFNAGLRYDYHIQTGAQWIPQAGLSFHLPRTIEVKAIVSKGFRNPTIRELFMFPPQNRDLLPESILNYEWSLSQHILKDNLSYSLNLFLIDGNNMIQTVYTNGRPLNVNTGNIRNHGLEASVNYRINKCWVFHSNYSWLHMKYPITAAPEHKAFIGIDYSNKKNRVSTGIQYIHGLYTSVTPVKKENFMLWNLRADHQFGKFMDLFVTGENLLGQQYEINAGYPMPEASMALGVNFRF